MNSFKLRLASMPVLGRGLLFVYRARVGLRYFQTPVWQLVRWLFASKEISNFTYDLDETNKRYLASLLAELTEVDFSTVWKYVKELEADEVLREHIVTGTTKSGLPFLADAEVRYGRRIGWYVLTRILKPQTVIETGVDKGLGSCILAAALQRNAAEGQPGRYFGTDIEPLAGYLLSGDYANHGKILYGDSIESLKKFDQPIDLFINDSDHSADYEAEEYLVIADKLSDRAVILGDNSHCTSKLLEFSLQTGRRFVYFQERPEQHWYHGAGIGFSLPHKKMAQKVSAAHEHR